MQFLKFVGNILQASQRTARSLERSVQEVVEVLQPGPLGSTALRWDAHRRANADAAVQQASTNWQALQQQLQQQEIQQHELQQEQQQLQLWQAEQLHQQQQCTPEVQMEQYKPQPLQ